MKQIMIKKGIEILNEDGTVTLSPHIVWIDGEEMQIENNPETDAILSKYKFTRL